MSNIETKRHSLSHILAAAVAELYPQAKFAIGPAIDNGFYYDIDFGENKVNDENLKEIEKKMKHLIKQNLKFERKDVAIDDALAEEERDGNVYKAELISDLRAAGESSVSYFASGKFTDLCRGPHIENTNEIKEGSWKLDKLAGAYWKGDEKNKMLTRIYGLAFESKEELDDYLVRLKWAEDHDHRKLSKELDLFMISEDVGKGLPLWLPNGALVRRKLEDYMYEKEYAKGYKYVITPVLTHKKLYETSGHLAHYKEDMYNPIDIEGEEYYLKPMNCPHHHQIYNNKTISYRELPLRLSEFGHCHRFERSGALTGLIRARCFTQNDAHIYCRQDQLKDELMGVLAMFREVYDDFGIKDFWFRLSLPDFENNPEKFGDVENKEMWDKAADSIREAMDRFQVKYVEGVGEATFYGPKIDVQIRNVLGKEDTIATAQVDFYSANKFDLNFINDKGEKEKAVIIHRAIMGSFDRFFSFLVEQTGGAFPVWLSPVQVKVLSVGEGHIAYCHQLAQEFKAANVRVEIDDSSETVGNKTRKAVMEKVPYVLVVGDQEMNSDKLAVRDRGVRETRQIAKTAFIREVSDKNANRSL